MKFVRHGIPTLISVGLSLGLGFVAGQITRGGIEPWYTALEKPPLTPPNWLFAPVWTVLYLLMGIAAARVWNYGKHHRWGKTALFHYGLQLTLNILWTLVFFYLQQPFWGLLVIGALWIFIERTLRWFRTVDRWASWMMIPYLIWVSFAAYLNFGIWWLNPVL